MENTDDLKVNDKISFTIKDPYDNNTYEATITAICDFSIAKTFADLVPRYESIKKVDSTLAPIDKLSYLVLHHIQNGLSSTVVIAKEWIELSSLTLIQINKSFDIRIYDRYTSNDQKQVLDLLQAHGFKCNILTT